MKLGQNPHEFCLHGIPGYMIDTKSKKNVFTRISGRQKCCLIVVALLLYKQ